jgi:nitrite reductase/ring-hydroxylating ferredoxin subunit
MRLTSYNKMKRRVDDVKDEYVFATEPIPRGERKLVHILGREIAIFHVEEGYVAIDNKCYHKGGSLIEGDIEDLDQRTCIICPEHHYHIDMNTGEGLFINIHKVFSKGLKQRVHEVEQRQDGIYLHVLDISLQFESDWFCDDTSELRKTRKRKLYY